MSGHLADNELTLLVNRCLMLGTQGARLSPMMKEWIAEGLGGVALYLIPPRRVRAFTAEIHAIAPDVLIAADEEGGDITRLHHTDGSPTPGNLALGFADDLDLTRATGRAIGSELAAAGIDMTLAPVADVNVDPNNPVIGTRSFGSDPDLVARHVVAYIQGLGDTRVIAVAKHFPGHGDVHQDSHFTIPTTTGDLTPHLVPFRAAISAGVAGVLTAHVAFPSMDDLPATLSRRILTDLLRDEMGFEGLVVTDSLTMDAIGQGTGIAQGAVRALTAGADLILMNSDETTHRGVRDHVVRAIQQGDLGYERVAEAADRVRTLARKPRATSEAADPPGYALRPYADLTDRRLPLTTPPYVIEVAAPRRGVSVTAGSLLTEMQRRDPRVDGHREFAKRAETPPPGDRPVVLVVRDAHRDPEQRQALRAHADAIVVGIGTSYDAHLAPGRYVGVHGAGRPNLESAAELLLG